jgi:outer membrane immunogenic protein
MKIVAIALLAVLPVVSPAFAQNTVVADSADPVPFAGLRIEATLGYDRMEGSFREDDTVYYDGYDGVGVGAEIGYDVPLSPVLLLGGYAGVSHANQQQCDEVFGSDELCQKAGYGINAGVRLSYRVGSRALIYARGGYSQAQLKLAYTETGFGTSSETEIYRGFHGGFGGEYLLGRGLYAKVDLTRSDFRTKDRLYQGVDFQRVQAVVGAGYRF